jgi:hypothetical protein
MSHKSEMDKYARLSGASGKPLCFSINSKDLFSPSLNPGMDMTAGRAIFVKALADAKAQMDEALARGELPAIDEEKLELIMTHVRYHQDKLAAYQRDVTKFMTAVLSQKTLDQAATFVRKSFNWSDEFQPYGLLVARAILQFETNRRTTEEKFYLAKLQAAKDVAKKWGVKP